MNKNYIVLNGKHYDAVTGALIQPIANSTSETRTSPRNTNHHAPRLQSAKNPRPISHLELKPVKKVVSRAHHGEPNVLSPRKPEQPKTLMRRVVHKPSHTQKTAMKPAYPLAKTGENSTITPKVSITNVDGLRLRRAQKADKSKHVSHFTALNGHSIQTKLKPVAVKTTPVHAEIAEKHHQPTMNHADTTPAAKKTALLEQALANATSHEEPEHRPKKIHRFRHQRLVSSLAGLAAVLLVVGFVTYLNKASVELQLASVRAGFQASMPGYAPAGYERQAAKAADSKVAINFISPVQNKGFTLTQEASGWDSQTLFDSIVAEDNTTYQTIQSNGRTIYIYGNDKAAWVDGGILYKVAGDAKLNSDQVISLARSM